MRSGLMALESRLQHVGVMAEREAGPAVFVKLNAGDDSNSGLRAELPVKTIERGLELLLQQRDQQGSSQGRRTVQSAAQITRSRPVGAEGELPPASSRSMTGPAYGHVEHVVDAATMLERAKHADEDADPPRSSSPVERAHSSLFYEPRALSPPSSAVKPRGRVGSPVSQLHDLQHGIENLNPHALGGRTTDGSSHQLVDLRERRRSGQQHAAPIQANDQVRPAVGAEEKHGHSLSALKQQTQAGMTWEESDDDEDERARLRLHSAAHRDTNAGKVITTYAEHSARQEVPSICGNDSDSGKELELELEEEQEQEEEQEEEEEDAAAAFEKRLADAKERRSSPLGESNSLALLCCRLSPSMVAVQLVLVYC
jgi:hypothetical protein